MTETMKAMILTGHGGMEKYDWREDWPKPRAGAGEALIRVHATGLNNTDVNTRAGWYSKAVHEATTGGAYAEVGENDTTWGGSGVAFPRIQGADICGTVEAVGEGVDTAFIGKRVIADNWLRDWSDPMNLDKAGYFGSERDGGFAEYTTTDACNLAAIDSDLSDAELATFSCSYTTAEGMLMRTAVGPDDRVLVTGASGGVGSALIQLAKRRGATVVGLASPAKHAALAPVGADALLPRAPEDLPGALKEAIGHETVTVVCDIVGGPYFPIVIDAIARGGRYGCSGAIAGPNVDLDLRTMYLNDLTFHGSTITPPEAFRNLVNYIERGEVRPMLAETFPLAELKTAQQAFIAKRHVGNIAVIP